MADVAPINSGLESGRPVVSRPALWFALLGGGAAWTLHLMLAYIIAEFGCLSGWGHTPVMGVTLVTWSLLGLTGAALTLAGVAVGVSRRLDRKLRTAAGGERWRASAFTAHLGFISNVVFGVVILVQTLPIFYFWRGC